ncbi:MAG: hypothetical protein EXR69_11490 [Myxococcales bacterium]|nr:hypothetical protein [Myxococcales bacterium]
MARSTRAAALTRLEAEAHLRPVILERLARLDPTQWGIPLSSPMLRETWRCALAGFPASPRALDLRGRTVLVVGSANVYTALLPWMVLLTEAGADVRVKPARGQEEAVRAMATAIRPASAPQDAPQSAPGRQGRLTVLAWRGGEDDEAEAAAILRVDALIAFGGDEALAALGERARHVAPRAQFFGFGPRFGIGVAEDLTEGDAANRVVRDALLYDGRGCMSPAALFTATSGRTALSRLGAALSDAEAWVKEPGALSDAEAAGIRERVVLTRAIGGLVLQGQRGGHPDVNGPTVLYSPTHFRPFALPRVIVIHPMALLPAVLDWRDRLGTVAGHAPDLPALRRCQLGEMQIPVHDGTHEGIDVMGLIST